MRLHDPLGDGEAEIRAHPGGLPRLPEPLEDVGKVARGNPEARVAYREPDFVIDERRSDRDRTSSFGGELDRFPIRLESTWRIRVRSQET